MIRDPYARFHTKGLTSGAQRFLRTLGDLPGADSRQRSPADSVVDLAGAAPSLNVRRIAARGWLRRRAGADAAFEPRSRRPKNSPTRTPSEVVALILNLRAQLAANGLDAGPHTIAWHLETHHGITVSVSTIRRRLLDAGVIEPEPRKRPRTSYIRFQADLPNETWQSDFTSA